MTTTITWSPAQKKIIENCNSNTYIAAGPGSGKSTTLSGIAQELLKSTSNKLMLLTFTNKAAKSILSKVSNLESAQVIGGTFHSICYRMLKETGNDFNICDESKKRLIIKKIFNCRKDKDIFEEKYEKISQNKGTFPVVEDEDVRRYNEELVKYNMLDFDDLITHGIHLFSTRKRPEMGITHVMVDELQDTSQAQLELLKSIYYSTNATIIGVGDDDQCHPEGNKILTTKGYIDIKDLDSKVHKVPSYDGHGKLYGLSDPYGYSITKSCRGYTGSLYTISTKNNSFTCTYNHKCYVQWIKDKAKEIYVTYLMKRENRFRIGQCKLIERNGSLHLGIRSRIEKADCTWILGIHSNRKESLREEQILSIKYRIPTITFEETNCSIHFKQDTIDSIFNELNHMYSDAIDLLAEFNRDINYPIWIKSTNIKQGARTFFITQACNIIPNIMCVGEYDGSRKLIKSEVISIKNKYADNIKVYSLNVEKFHNYVCNQILVSNSIYGWRGARYKNVEDFINEFKCTIRELGINYRSVYNIVSRSKRLIENNNVRIKKDLRSNTEQYGTVQPVKQLDMYKEIDWIISKCKIILSQNKEIAILYRNRLNKMRIEFELKKQGIAYKVNDSTDISDRSSFRVLICMMRIACGYYDVYDLEEASKGMKRIGAGTVDKIKSKHQETGAELDDVIKELCKKSKRIQSATAEIKEIQTIFKELGSDAALKNLLKKLPEHLNDSYDINLDIYTFLKDVTKDYKCTVTDIRLLCNEFGLDAREQRVENEEAKIELSTVHGYKGLERDVVIMPFCNSYLDPTKKRINMAEERRIFYVAFTRAKESVYLSYCGPVPIFIRELGF